MPTVNKWVLPSTLESPDGKLIFPGLYSNRSPMFPATDYRQVEAVVWAGSSLSLRVLEEMGGYNLYIRTLWYKLSFINYHIAHWLTWFFKEKKLFSCDETQWDFFPISFTGCVEPLKGFTSVKYYPQHREIKSEWAFFILLLWHVKGMLEKWIDFPGFQKLPEWISVTGF